MIVHVTVSDGERLYLCQAMPDGVACGKCGGGRVLLFDLGACRTQDCPACRAAIEEIRWLDGPILHQWIPRTWAGPRPPFLEPDLGGVDDALAAAALNAREKAAAVRARPRR